MDDTTNVEIVDQDPNVVLFAGDGDVVECPDEIIVTGKSFSEALFLASTNPQYDKRLFIELQVHYMKIVSSEHVQNMLCT